MPEQEDIAPKEVVEQQAEPATQEDKEVEAPEPEKTVVVAEKPDGAVEYIDISEMQEVPTEQKAKTGDINDYVGADREKLERMMKPPSLKERLLGRKRMEFVRLNQLKPDFRMPMNMSMAIIYKGKTPLWEVAFLPQTDADTNMSWAVFDQYNFYGNPKPWFMWQKKVEILPFNKSSDFCDYIGSGYLAAFDMVSMRQLQLHRAYDMRALHLLVDDKNFMSADLALRVRLAKFKKPKLNSGLLMKVGIVLAVVLIGAWYYIGHPTMFTGLLNGLGFSPHA